MQDIRNSTTSILDNSYNAKKTYTYDIYGQATEDGDQDFLNDCTFTGAQSEGGGVYENVLRLTELLFAI